MLSNIKIQNYRNLGTKLVSLSEGINLIVAPNGTGKTNFLESIYYTIFAESFRPVSSNLEFSGNPDFPVRVSIEYSLDKIDVLIEQKKRTFFLNNKKTYLSKIPSKFPIVLFAPQSVDLVSREPGIRRQDLDSFLSMLYPEYKQLISQYKTVLKNRNAMIKMIRELKSKKEDLSFWTEKLINLSIQIYIQRMIFFNEINIEMSSTISLLENEVEENDSFSSLQVRYICSLGVNTQFEFETAIRSKFNDNLDKEIIVGKTLYGVHKDDYEVTLKENPLRFMGSRGQQRIGILLMKLAQLFYLQNKLSIKPVLLLDDVMSELDNYNREKISTILRKIDNQIIMTTADDNEIPSSLKNISNEISIL